MMFFRRMAPRAWRPGGGWLLPLLLLTIASPASSARAAGPADEIARYLQEIDALTSEALAAAEVAASGESIEAVKAGADAVYRAMWGISSGLLDPGADPALQTHGWKERWQTDETDFDSVYAIRYSGLPPTITDPGELGIIGRGRHVRTLLNAIIADSTAPREQRMHAEHVVIALNNVIGWMQMESGRIKNEIQPRVDLTRVWDAPVAFWNSTSDTGWAFEALAQAINILKVQYDDLSEARTHAASMADLIRHYREGADADGDGRIAPIMMEGGLATAIQHAGLAGMEVGE